MRALLPILLLFTLSCHQRAGDAPPGQHVPMAMYNVQWGDTLEWIAWDFDVPGGYPQLAKLNHLPDPDYITMGQHLRIPRSGPATTGLPPWPSDEAIQDPPRECQVERLPAPHAAQVPGCASAACVTLDGGWQRVCSCEATQGTPGFVLIEGGRPVMAWPAPVQGQAGDDPARILGTAADFDVIKTDLDGDGRREHLLAFRRELNDLGMSWWNLAVLSGVQPQAPPLLFTAANYGEGSVIRSRGSSECNLLTTTWELAWEPGPYNDGWTLLGRPMSYQGGQLVPVQDVPIYSRRLYYSFQPGAIPLPGGLSIGTPLRDLSHRNAHPRLVEPAEQAWRHQDNPVTISDPHPRLDSELGVVQDLELQRDGTTWQLSWGAYDQGFDGLGDQASGRLFPPGYRPAEPGWPSGRRATVASYQRLYGASRQLVWLTP